MRRILYDEESTWWFAYRSRVGKEFVTYGREWLSADPERFVRRAAWLDPILPAGPGLVVGCAYGFLLEALHDAGRGGVWGTDTSAWIHETLGAVTRPDVAPRILRKDPRDEDALDAFATLTGGPPRWVVTEEILSAYPDDEVRGILAAVDALAPRATFHVVNSPASPPFYSRTLDEYRALGPGRFFDPSGLED